MLARLRAGQTASCIKLNLSDARVAEIAAACGFDCIWLDMEHVPNSIEAMRIRFAAKVHDVDALIRTRRGSYSDLVLPLEMDGSGIIGAARDECKGCKANRLADPVSSHRPTGAGWWQRGWCLYEATTEEYIAHANRERFVIIQIEDPEPLAELDEIASVEGIDMLFTARVIWRQGIGQPGKFDDARIADARRRIAAAAKKHGKFAGTVGSIASLPALVELGYQFISVGADVVGLREYFSKIASSFGTGTVAPSASVYGAEVTSKQHTSDCSSHSEVSMSLVPDPNNIRLGSLGMVDANGHPYS